MLKLVSNYLLRTIFFLKLCTVVAGSDDLLSHMERFLDTFASTLHPNHYIMVTGRARGHGHGHIQYVQRGWGAKTGSFLDDFV